MSDFLSIFPIFFFLLVIIFCAFMKYLPRWCFFLKLKMGNGRFLLVLRGEKERERERKLTAVDWTRGRRRLALTANFPPAMDFLALISPVLDFRKQRDCSLFLSQLRSSVSERERGEISAERESDCEATPCAAQLQVSPSCCNLQYRFQRMISVK